MITKKNTQTAVIGLGLVMLLQGCASSSLEDPVITQEHRYQVNVNEFEQSLKQVLKPFYYDRVETGKIDVFVSNSRKHFPHWPAIQSHLENHLNMAVDLHFGRASSNPMNVNLEVTLVPGSCKYKKDGHALNLAECNMLRNQYILASNKAFWFEGSEYKDTSSALKTGAVQRLMKGAIKVAEKQTVTGE
ncbi:hypothetical protein HC752_04415 [Vibrio sp. S9_S30]|uniref:hypothetical protein n=1 Tax=Vibrio sp. S9_S30 TaxID=2720226 RepID=UPI0016813911|nr:hypothetical protein [Vibrio sp. S9_S30]MBD1556172.1 hypothetical protein [Vibrio sp. S9_S30]